jgi:hypothetical protein
VPEVTVTLRQPRIMVTWTVLKYDAAAENDPYADTIVVRAAETTCGHGSGMVYMTTIRT